MKRMQSGKAVGPDDIPVVIWRWLGERAMDLLTRLFSTILEGERSPATDVHSCSNYREIKLMSNTMKLWERAAKGRGDNK